ncbi:F-box/WD repeat-containing protein 9-like [Phymastichus coffea]|uniref:F-box/WD repeat-containing protein 9-like n=1 Tax=Phymastichus coffea TaxID=108790 RepID=UPI00273BAE2C|nr:F-box/WD repeat-containing protein 9-like [Phymastichus coffea]XP_058802169.1 F-box/WD repeat-containing protein 9-like [Phymastichus coffea]XP_058802170.1 F-box/WD repeat-containing protein 9-like [Phymastichus coffea]
MPDDVDTCSNCLDDDTLNLADLPVEIFLHICSFLDASTLVHCLSLTCKQFHTILNDNSIWKVRISQVWPNVKYPILPYVSDDELFWKLSCVTIERQANLWRNTDLLEKVWLNNVHYSTIDGLLLMHNGNICVSGGRDRTLVLYRLSSQEDSQHDTVSIGNAHDGWIWDLTAIENTIYSCSWDRSVKAWALTEAGLEHVTTYEMIVQNALLCVTSCPELSLFATGSYCKTVLVFDPRSGHSPIIKYQPHHRAVISLAMSTNYILSASEDKTVNVWDQRAGRTMKSVTISKESFPMSMYMQKDVVYVGDSGANLHILDIKQDFDPVKSYKTGHEKKITGVYAGTGCLITSSLDRTVKITSPTDPPHMLATLQYRNGEIAGIDYLNEVLAVSGRDAIEIWRPKTRAKC